MLADWMRQTFTVVFLLCVVIQKDWRLATGEPDRAAVRVGADHAHRAAHPPDHAQGAG